MSDPSREGRAGRVVPGVVALAVAALAFTKITSPDLGFLIATGRAVLSLGRIPATNVLSFTEPDHPWLLHEWIPSLIFEVAFRRGGPAGVLAVKIAVLVATWSLVLATARRLGASPIASALAAVAGAGAAATRFGERPQIFSNLALAGCALLLATAARAEPHRRARLVVLAGVVAALTAQVHAGATTSFVLLGTVALGLALEPARARLRGGDGGPSGLGPAIRVGAVALGSVALAALLLLAYHPQGARPLLVAFQLGADPYLHEQVVEFRSAFATPFSALHLYWAFGAIAVVLAVRSRRVTAAALVPLLVFAVLSLRFVRAVDAFAIVAAPAAAVGLDEALGARLSTSWGVAVLGALAVLLPLDNWFGLPLFARRFGSPPGVGIAEAVWPTKMFRFVEEEHLAGPAYVSDGWAGPWLGAFYPHERAFFDPRFEAYSPAFVRDVYRRIRYGEEGWEGLLDKYGVQLVLLKYTTPGERQLQGGKENLRQLLARSTAWSLVAFSDGGELFLRREGPNAEAAQRLAIPGVEPDRALFLGNPAAAALGLLKAVDRGFTDNRVLALAALAVDARGDRAVAQKLLDAADPADPHVQEARATLRR